MNSPADFGGSGVGSAFAQPGQNLPDGLVPVVPLVAALALRKGDVGAHGFQPLMNPFIHLVEEIAAAAGMVERGHTAAGAVRLIQCKEVRFAAFEVLRIGKNVCPREGAVNGARFAVKIGTGQRQEPCAVAAQVDDPDSVFSFYRQLVSLHKESKLISEGKIQFLFEQDEDLLAYRRYDESGELLVLCSLTALPHPVCLPEGWEGAARLLGNYPLDVAPALRPYECRVLQK